MDRYFYLQNPFWENPEITKKASLGFIRQNYINKLEKDFKTKFIQVLTGLRRVGKSTLALQFIYKIINKHKINSKHILCFSIEEPSITKIPIIEIINEFRSFHNIKSNTKIYVFIDEIQFKENWEQEIKSLYDTENIKFILTGSSALLLSEKLFYLTGRYVSVQVFPLNFNEYLQFKKVKINNEDNFLLDKYLNDFLLNGGMPEFVLNKSKQYLQTTVESILFKDLVSKFQLRNPKILMDLIYLLSDRVSCNTSSLKLSNILSINKDTALNYLNYLNKSFITSELLNYSSSRNKQIYNPPKVYFEDTGILNKYSSKTNYGALVENAVYNYLKIKTNNKIRVKFGYFYENKSEIDFVVSKLDKIILVESKWVDKFEEIDFKPLQNCLKTIKPFKIIYITKNLKFKKEISNNMVDFVPLKEFLMSKKYEELFEF